MTLISKIYLASAVFFLLVFLGLFYLLSIEEKDRTSAVSISVDIVELDCSRNNRARSHLAFLHAGEVHRAVLPYNACVKLKGLRSTEILFSEETGNYYYSDTEGHGKHLSFFFLAISLFGFYSFYRQWSKPDNN